MSQTRKIKRGMQKVPLSTLDKTIYTLMIFVSVAMGFILSWLCGAVIPTAISYALDESLVASNPEGFFWTMPMTFFLSICISGLAVKGADSKQPIFGNKKYKPPRFKTVISLPPLFSKEFRGSLTDKAKTKIRITALVFLGIFVICAILIPFGLFQRTVLDDDNNLTMYNSFNQITHSGNIEDAEKMIIDISAMSHKGVTRQYNISLKFVFKDEEYFLNTDSFAEMERKEAIEYMLYLKSFFKEGEYEITDIEYMDRLIDYRNYDAYETALVYELFDYSE